MLAAAIGTTKTTLTPTQNNKPTSSATKKASRFKWSTKPWRDGLCVASITTHQIWNRCLQCLSQVTRPKTTYIARLSSTSTSTSRTKSVCRVKLVHFNHLKCHRTCRSWRLPKAWKSWSLSGWQRLVIQSISSARPNTQSRSLMKLQCSSTSTQLSSPIACCWQRK